MLSQNGLHDIYDEYTRPFDAQFCLGERAMRLTNSWRSLVGNLVSAPIIGRDYVLLPTCTFQHA